MTTRTKIPVHTRAYSPLCVHVKSLWPAPARPAGCFRHNRAFWNNAAEAPGVSCLSLACLSLHLNAPWCGCHQRNNTQTQLQIRQNATQFKVHPILNHVSARLQMRRYCSLFVLHHVFVQAMVAGYIGCTFYDLLLMLVWIGLSVNTQQTAGKEEEQSPPLPTTPATPHTAVKRHRQTHSKLKI